MERGRGEMNTVRDRCGWGGSIALHKANLNHAHPAPCSLKDELLKLLETLALEDQVEKLAANGIKIRCDLAWVDTNDVQYLCAVSKQTLMSLLQYFKTTASGACRVTPEASCASPASGTLGHIT